MHFLYRVKEVKKELEKPAPEQPEQAHGVSGKPWDVLLPTINIP